VWRFASAFRLVDLVADGDEPAAARFLDWLHAEGFSGARVLSTLCCWFDLKPSEGQRALPRLLDMAAQRGLYLEVVALAGTKDGQLTPEQMQEHVAAVGAICAAHPSCAAIELANENAHSSQREELRDPGYLRQLRAAVPSLVPVSMGSNCCGQPDDRVVYPGGDYLTIHVERSGTRWARVDRLRHVRDAANASGLFAVDDESIGAGEREEPSRRTTDEDEFYARGALARILDIGATFHFDSGLQAAVPGPLQASAARAFIAGTRMVPDDVRLHLEEASAHRVEGAEHVYVGAAADRAVALALGPGAAFTLTPAAGWTSQSLRDTAAVRALALHK
jgi:hypothetical protein